MSTAYHYDPTNYHFIGATVADESPLEPGVYHYPDHSTHISPPSQYPPTGSVFIWDIISCKWIEKTIQTIPHFTLSDGLEKLRNERNKRLADVDWVAIKYFTQNIPYPSEWAQYVQELRDLPFVYPEPPLLSNGKLDINAIIWPIRPV